MAAAGAAGGGWALRRPFWFGFWAGWAGRRWVGLGRGRRKDLPGLLAKGLVDAPVAWHLSGPGRVVNGLG